MSYPTHHSVLIAALRNMRGLLERSNCLDVGGNYSFSAVQLCLDALQLRNVCHLHIMYEVARLRCTALSHRSAAAGKIGQYLCETSGRCKPVESVTWSVTVGCRDRESRRVPKRLAQFEHSLTLAVTSACLCISVQDIRLCCSHLLHKPEDHASSTYRE